MPKGIFVRENPAWNKDLTKDTDERVKRGSLSLIVWEEELKNENCLIGKLKGFDRQ